MIHLLDIIMDPDPAYMARIRAWQMKPSQAEKQQKKEAKQQKKEAKKKAKAEKKAQKKQEKAQTKSAKVSAANAQHSTYTEVSAPSTETASAAAFPSSGVLTVALLLTICIIFAFRLRVHNKR